MPLVQLSLCGVVCSVRGSTGRGGFAGKTDGGIDHIGKYFTTRYECNSHSGHIPNTKDATATW
jgi:hypothetical protein